MDVAEAEALRDLRDAARSVEETQKQAFTRTRSWSGSPASHCPGARE